ncbi:MAG: helix-turn-helix domain-containing protein [Clostridia bacterium]|nr:helix-turn-helix domain-containing protein [Clostridia bacterium]
MSVDIPKSNPEEYGQILAFGHGVVLRKGFGTDAYVRGSSYKFYVITGGKGTFYTNGVKNDLSEGDVYVTLPFDYYKVEADKDCDFKYNYISLDVSNETYASKFGNIWIYNKDGKNRIIRNEEAAQNIESIVLEMTNDSRLYHDILLSYLIKRFVISFAALFYSNSQSASSDLELCCNTLGYIDSHFYEIKNITAISQTLNYSHDYLTKVFRKFTGISLEEYHRVKKLDLAKLLLSQNNSASVVADKLYYSSVQSFSKAFKNHWGHSPKEYLDGLKK